MKKIRQDRVFQAVTVTTCDECGKKFEPRGYGGDHVCDICDGDYCPTCAVRGTNVEDNDWICGTCWALGEQYQESIRATHAAVEAIEEIQMPAWRAAGKAALAARRAARV